MLIKAFIILVMLVILFSLGSGLVYLVKDNGQGNRMVKALSWRIGLSLTLFLLLLVLFSLGIIVPHSVYT